MPEDVASVALDGFSQDFTARTHLGVLGRVVGGDQPAISPTPVALPPPRARPARVAWRRAALLAALGVALAIPVVSGRGMPLGAGAEADVGDDGAPSVAVDPRAGDLPAPDEGAPAAATRPFAAYEDLELVLPARGVVRVGYHEAAFGNALALAPLGRNVDNQNTTKFTTPAHSEGPDYLVLSSRGRPQAATSAVDIVMAEGTPVNSPVTGRVATAEGYSLYGRYPDTKVEIVPDARPDLRVVIIHVTGVSVRPGDRVEAGRTAIAASPNRFPFPSHIDRYADGTPDPHVHLEVKIPDANSP